MQKYSILNNVKYIYKNSFRLNKRLFFLMVINFISSIAVPILGTVLTSAVVYLLSNGYGLLDYVLFISIMVVVMLIFEGIKSYSTWNYSWDSTVLRISDFWNHLSLNSIECSYETIEPKSGQKKLSTAFEALDSNWIGIEGLMKEVPVIITNIVAMLIYMVLVSIYSPLVLIPMVGMLVIDLFFAHRADKIIEADRERNNAAYYERTYLSSDIANPINGKDIRIYKLENWFKKRFDALTKGRMNAENKYHLNSLFSEISHTGFDLLRDAIAYLTLIALVVNGNLSTTEFVFMIGITAGFATWINGFSEAVYRLKSDSTQINAYRAFIDGVEEEKNKEKKSVNSITKPIEIEFRNVYFTYPDTDKEIIHNLSFKIKGGEKIALVGNNGAGKTTIIKLLTGLYSPTSGLITINGEDISEFNRSEYMSLISAVFQDTKEFAFTIKENVGAKPIDKIDDDKFIDAITKAGLKEKIDSLPNKELTYITQNFNPQGILLSGGETQRLMLARALYKDAPILLLDEPTAALDPINEEKMYLLYESFSENNTSIFISHRLASTRFCDRIFYLEQGKILEIGNHEELLKLNGKYKEIFDIQAQYYIEGGEKHE